MKKFLVLLIIISSNISASPIPARDGNYCTDDIYRFFEQRFHASGLIAQLDKVSGSSGSTWYYYVTTSLCQGYFVIDMNERDSSICTNPQYGTRVQTFDRVYATNECQHLMPEDEFPTLN